MFLLKDEHTTYLQALSALNEVNLRNTYFAITSVPCFEYWLLLHFDYSTRPYAGRPGRSSGSQVVGELKQYMPSYEKGQRRIFSNLIAQLDQAKRFAERALQESKRNQTDNPSTRVHELIQVLQDLKG